MFHHNVQTNRLREIAKLIRLEYLGFSCVCVIGGLAGAGKDLSISDGATLFLLHMLTIIFGFVHNDLCDTGFDRTAAALQKRPLVHMTVSRAAAWLICLTSAGAAMFLTLLAYRSILMLLLITGALVLAALYNLTGKRLPCADIFFALSATLLCLIGGLSVVSGYALTSLPPLVWIVAAIQFADHCFFNIAGAMKDVEIDRTSGAVTTPLRLGMRVLPDGSLKLPLGFMSMMILLKLMTIMLVVLPFFLLPLPRHLLQVLVLAVLAFAALYTTLTMLRQPCFDRKEFAMQSVIQDSFGKLLVPLMLFCFIGWGWFVFFFLPPVWFMLFNRLMTGAIRTPPETY